jgi:hypothetical protein
MDEEDAGSPSGRIPPRFERFVPWALAIAAMLLYQPFVARYPTEWDGVQLTLGLDHFDVTEHSPHPPGYWLYVALGRLVRALTPLSGVASLRLVAALAAAATVGLTWVLGKELGGRWLAWAGAAFLLTSPFMLFYGASVSTYPFDGLLSVVLLLLAWRARPGSGHAIAAALILGVGAGLRQTSLIVLAPVLAVAAWRSIRSWRAAAATVVSLALGILAWLVPTALEQPGGLERYVSFSREFVGPILKTSSALHGATHNDFIRNVGEATAFTLAGVGLLLPITLVGLIPWRRRRRGAAALLTLAVALPLGAVIVIQYGKEGYLLAYLPALALLLLWPASGEPRVRRYLAGAVLAAMCAVNLARFVSAPALLPARALDRPSLWFTQGRHGAPFNVTAHQLRRVDDDTEAYLALGRVFEPGRDVLVYVTGNGNHRFRYGTYTLPEFVVHWVTAGADSVTGRHRRVLSEGDHTIEVPAGGEAVFVLDVDTPEIRAATAAGRVRPVRLPTGPTVWAAGPGVVLFGVAVVAGQPRAPL